MPSVDREKENTYDCIDETESDYELPGQVDYYYADIPNAPTSSVVPFDPDYILPLSQQYSGYIDLVYAAKPDTSFGQSRELPKLPTEKEAACSLSQIENTESANQHVTTVYMNYNKERTTKPSEEKGEPHYDVPPN